MVLLASTQAQAQTRWAVLAATTTETEAARAGDLAEHARAALEARGEVVLDRDRAIARLSAGLGAPFEPAPDELIRRLARAAEAVLDDVAFGRNERALELGEPLLEQAEPHVVALGRVDHAARDLGNTCLFLVRAHVQLQQADRARTRAETCVRLVPQLDSNIDERIHPGSVRAVVAAVRADLDAGRLGGTLSAQASATDPEGCSVRVNGRVVGRTPWTRLPLPVGSYAVQAECSDDRPGRVFRVTVSATEPTRLTMPVRLTSMLDARGLAVIYPSSSDLDARLAADVEQLGRVLDVDGVLVALIDAGTMSVRAFEVTPGGASARLTGSAQVAEPIDTATTREAVALARSGRRLGEPRGERGRQDGSESRARASGGGDVAVAVLGGSLLTVGVAALGVGWYFWTEVGARGQELNRFSGSAELTDRTHAFDEADTPVIIAGSVAAIISGVGSALLVSQADEPVPWWTWVIGAAGLGVGAVGIYFLTTEGECYGNSSGGAATACARRSPTWLLGMFVLEHAAPLLAVPITSWIRAAVGAGSDARSGTATLRLSAEGAQLSWSGSF